MSLTLQAPEKLPVLTLKQRREMQRVEREQALGPRLRALADGLRQAARDDNGIALRLLWNAWSNDALHAAWGALESDVRRRLRDMVDGTEGW